MRSTPRPLAALFLVALPVLPLGASEVSRTPPPVYAEQLAALLTPVEDVLPGGTAFPENKTGGVHLLQERIFYRDPAGVDFRVLHIVKHVVEQSGVETVGSDTYTFDRAREEIFLIEAATILPDGRRQTLDTKAAFIQTPQREADNSLYTSEAELQLVFPNVAPGTSTEAIVLIREHQPVMPGEFALVTTFGAGWPVYRHRTVLDFPAADLAGLHAFTNSAAVPEPQTDAYAPGRERRTWEREKLPFVAWEEHGPSWEFRAPTLWLTTLESWDEVAAWYDGLVADRSELGPELAAQVDGWTEGLADRRAILDKLTEVVANEIRYVGLEFGIAGYQPHACREVWENRYGDCKDKANLLRAMLAHKGIRSHLVLLLTTGMGRIEKSSPSWKHFNHAILAVGEDGGGWLFCDPTIKHLPAGAIGLSALGRDVLIIRDGRAEWAATPDTLASAIRISAELALAPDGSLSGWFTFGATGTDAAYYTEYFNGLDRDDRLRSIQRYAERFFSGAEVVDVDYAAPTGSVRELAVRGYFVRAPRAAGDQTLTFPYPPNWLPSVSTAGERRFPYGTARREESVNVTISLPENWTVRSLPAAFSAPSNTADFNASWNVVDGTLHARLAWHPLRAALAPPEYGTFQRSVRALTSWLEQPAVLTPKDGAAASDTAATPAAGQALRDFPILPTGAGQLRLIEERFPSANHRFQRRAALERTLQWFPHDTETIFEAQVKLALLDWNADVSTDAEFADRVAGLLARHGSRIGVGNRTWAEYLEAKARWGATKDPACITRLRQLADDTSLSEYRRGWSAEAAGRYLSESDPAAALAFLRRHDDYDSEARDAIVRLIARTYTGTRDASGLRDWSGELAREHGTAADALLSTAIAELLAAGETLVAADRTAFAAALDEVVTDAQAFPRAHQQLAEFRATIAATAAQAEFRRELTAWLEAQPPAWWTRERDPAYADVAVVKKRIHDRNDANDAEAVVDATLQLILHHEPEFADLAQYTRWSLWWLRRSRLADEFLDRLGQATLHLPPAADEEVIECWDLYSRWLAEVGRLDEARALRERTLVEPGVQDYQRVEAGGELGLLEFNAGNAEAALQAFHQIAALHLTYKWSANYLYPAVVLHLERGEYDEALRLIALLREENPENVAKTQNATAVPHLLRAAENPDAIKAWWERRAAWRPTWDMFLRAQSFARESTLPLTLDTDATALGQRIKHAAEARDLPAFLRDLDALALTSQWVPMYASDFVGLAPQAEKFSPLLKRSFYELALLIMTDLPPVDPQFDYTGRFWEVAFLTDLGRTKAAAGAAHRLFVDAGPDHRLGQVGLRLWVANAGDTPDAATAIRTLVETLAGAHAFYERLNAVEVLLNAYAAAGDVPAQQALLEREVNRADFDATTAIGRRLSTRHGQMRTQHAAAATLTHTIQAWRESHSLGWLDHVHPRALDEPRYAALKPPLFQTPSGFTEAESVKVNLLAALDERLPVETRSSAFYAAAWDLAFATYDLREFAAIFADMAAVDTVPAESRALSMASAVDTLLAHGQHDLAHQLAGKPAFLTIREDIRADYARARQANARAAAGGDRWEHEALAILATKPLERFSITTIGRFVRQLAFAAEFERAQQLITAARQLTIDPGRRETMATLRLEWTRMVQNIRDQAELIAILRDAINGLPEADRAPTERVPFLFGFESTSGLTDQEVLAAAAHSLTSGEHLPDEWGSMLYTLIGARVFASRYPMFFPELLERGLRSSAPDAALAVFVGAMANGGDIDHDDIRARVTALLNGFTAAPAAASFPQTVQAIGVVRAYHTLRTSLERRPAALFEHAHTQTLPASMLASMQLRFHQARGHHADALQLIAALGADQLSEPQAYLSARRELSLAGRGAEVELLDESMRSILERRMPAFWMDPELFGVGDWIDVVDVLEARDLVTDAWFDRAVATSASAMRNTTLRLGQAWLNKDWPAIRAAADAALGVMPDTYDLYYLRAVARHELGDDPGACDDLRTFLRYSLSSADYPAAVALLRELAPGEELELPE